MARHTGSTGQVVTAWNRELFEKKTESTVGKVGEQ